MNILRLFWAVVVSLFQPDSVEEKAKDKEIAYETECWGGK